MRVWIIVLRVAGCLLLLFGVLGSLLRLPMYTLPFTSWNAVYDFALPVIENLALVALCFAAASALVVLGNLNQRIARATSRRRVDPAPKDIAPVAPNWQEINPPRQSIKMNKPVRRIDRMYYTYRSPSTRKHSDKN